MRQKLSSHKASILLMTMVFMVALTILATVFLNSAIINSTHSDSQLSSKQALYTAEAGLNKAIYYLENTAPDSTVDASWRTTAYPSPAGSGSTDPQQISLTDGGTYTIWVETSGANSNKIRITSAGTYNGLTRIVQEEITQPTPKGLKGWWNFEENSGLTAGDSSGNGHNGDLTGHSPSWTSGHLINTYALSFDGNSNYVSLPVLGISGSTARTVSAWIYPTSSALGSIYSSGTVADYNLFEIVFDQTANNNIHVIGHNSDVYTAAGTITLNTWNHVVVTYQAGSVLNSSNVKIYINGVSQSLTDTGNQAQVLNSTNSNYSIGSRAGSSEFFPGKIDDARIYNQTLSSDDIQTLYNYTGSTIATMIPGSWKECSPTGC